MSSKVIVIGAGGHAAVVCDALLRSGAQVLGFTDADPKLRGNTLCGLPVLGSDDVLRDHDPNHGLLALGLGSLDSASSRVRERVQVRLQAQGWRFCTVQHPSAIVSPFAQLAEGVQLMAGAVVQPHARIGTGTIVNTRAVVEHDVVIGSWSHVAPGAVVCGGTHVGAHSHVGAGAVLRQGLRLGDHTLIGAGAAVVRSYAGGGTLLGVPAHARDDQS